MARPTRPTQATPKRTAPPKQELRHDKQISTPDNRAIAKTNGGAVAVPDDIDFFQDRGAGQENVRQQDMQIPLLRILQTNSPEVNKRDGAYIDGAEASHILNTVTRETYDGEQGIWLVPALFVPTIIEWVPRDEGGGGGFVADHGLAEGEKLLRQAQQDEKKRRILPNGNQLVQTGQHFCIHVSDTEAGIYAPVVVPMSSTQLSLSRRWNAQINLLQIPHPTEKGKTFNPASFYMAYRLVTVPKSNAQGDWFGWEIAEKIPTIELPNGAEIYKAARGLKDSIMKGEARAATETASGPAPEDNSGEAASTNRPPF